MPYNSTAGYLGSGWKHSSCALKQMDIISGRCFISSTRWGKRPLAIPYWIIGLRRPVMESLRRCHPGRSRSESLVPSARIFSSRVYGPCRWQMAAPASIPRTYSSARASMPCGLKGLRGYDIVESHVTVMTSFSMGFSSNFASYFPSKFLFLDDHYHSAERAAAHAIECIVNPIERKAGGHIGADDAGGHHAHGLRHILPATVA